MTGPEVDQLLDRVETDLAKIAKEMRAELPAPGPATKPAAATKAAPPPPSPSPIERLRAIAAELRKADPKLTPAQAMTAAGAANPELVAENKRRRGK